MGRQLQNLSRVATSLVLFLVISIFLPSAKAIAENKTYPTAYPNNNLSPIQAWRSAEYCMLKTSSSCQDKFNYTLTDKGWLNVTQADGQEFCKQGGCADHTRDVLLCLHEVNKDYYFANNATIQDLTDTIDSGCNSPQGFTGVSKYGSHPSHGIKLNSGPIFAAVSAAAVLSVILL